MLWKKRLIIGKEKKNKFLISIVYLFNRLNSTLTMFSDYTIMFVLREVRG